MKQTEMVGENLKNTEYLGLSNMLNVKQNTQFSNSDKRCKITIRLFINPIMY